MYGMDARYRRGPPGVRDAFSKALGAKNRLLVYGMEIRCEKKGSLVYGVQFIQKSAAPEAAPRGINEKSSLSQRGFTVS